MENSMKSKILLFITDEEKEKFSQLSNPKEKLELFWNHTIFDKIFDNQDCFESTKDDNYGELTAFIADELCKEGNYQGALEFYNKGVIFSTNTSDNFKQCLLNRSACLRKMKKPDLANQDCNIVIEAQDQDEKTEKENNSNMCIPEEKRHPIFVDGSNLFDIIYTEDKGRHAVANRDIHVGEVIVIENPVCSRILPAHIFSHCHNCWSVLEAPLPCPSCTLAVYCSTACISDHKPHAWECGNKMLMSMEHSSLSFQLITHFGMEHILNLEDKLENPNPKWAAQSENSPEKARVYAADDLENAFHHENPNQEDMDQLEITIQTIFLLKCLERKHFFVNYDFSQVLLIGKLMMHLTAVLPANAHGIGKMIIKKTPLATNGNSAPGINQDVIDKEVKSFGVGLYNTLSLFNHSCNPSFTRFNKGNQVFCVATKNIKKGSELYENYGVSCFYHTKEFRQKSLLDRYGFVCTCAPCTEDWPAVGDGLDKERSIMLTLHKAIVQKMWINNGNKQFIS